MPAYTFGWAAVMLLTLSSTNFDLPLQESRWIFSFSSLWRSYVRYSMLHPYQYLHDASFCSPTVWTLSVCSTHCLHLKPCTLHPFSQSLKSFSIRGLIYVSLTYQARRTCELICSLGYSSMTTADNILLTASALWFL